MTSHERISGSILGRRVAAFVVDVGLLFVVLGPTGALLQWILGVSPTTGREIYATLLLTFSIPVWTYFTVSDASLRGATLGKRWLGLSAQARGGGRIGWARALGRTALKLLPWELTHTAFFLIPPSLGTMTTVSWAAVIVAYALGFVYLGVAWRTGGHRSLPDFAAQTEAVRTG